LVYFCFSAYHYHKPAILSNQLMVRRLEAGGIEIWFQFECLASDEEINPGYPQLSSTVNSSPELEHRSLIFPILRYSKPLLGSSTYSINCKMF